MIWPIEDLADVTEVNEDEDEDAKTGPTPRVTNATVPKNAVPYEKRIFGPKKRPSRLAMF